jgi:hypothetical protein
VQELYFRCRVQADSLVFETSCGEKAGSYSKIFGRSIFPTFDGSDCVLPIQPKIDDHDMAVTIEMRKGHDVMSYSASSGGGVSEHVLRTGPGHVRDLSTPYMVREIL